MLVIVQSMYIYIYIRTGLGWKNHFLGSNLGYTVFFLSSKVFLFRSFDIGGFFGQRTFGFYWFAGTSLLMFVCKFGLEICCYICYSCNVDGSRWWITWNPWYFSNHVEQESHGFVFFFLDVWHANMLHTFFSRRQTFIYQLFKRSVINFLIIWCIIYFLLNGT